MPEEGGVRGGELLARVSFPLYTVKALSGQHILVAGGGGSAKTGVANGFQIFELSFNGKQTEAEEVAWHETGDRAIMNCITFDHSENQSHKNGDGSTFGDLLDGDHVLAAGLDNELQVYHIRRRLVSERADGHVLADEDKFVQTRKRRKSESLSGGHEARSYRRKSTSPSGNRRIGFDIAARNAVKTDFLRDDDSFQKVVRVSRDQRLLVTGGCDGHVRVWQYPGLTRCADIAAHSKDVDDLDINPASNKIVSIGKDNRAFVWNLADGKQVTRLEFNAPHAGVRYMFKKCRYGCVEADLTQSALFTVHNAVANTRCPAYLVKWNTKTYVPEKRAECAGSLSALAVSSDGRYLCVGSMESGDVTIYIAFSLQVVKRVERAHHMFVTGLEFLPESAESRAVSGNSDVSVISISVDNQVKIHHIPQPGTISVLAASVVAVVVMVTTFIVCSWLGL